MNYDQTSKQGNSGKFFLQSDQYQFKMKFVCCNDHNLLNMREQGWRSGESACLPPMCPGFDSWTRRHMWAEFVGSLLCSERFFSGNSGFPLSSKNKI